MNRIRQSQVERAQAALSEFRKTELDQLLARHLTTDLANHWVEFLKGVIRDVPAYRKFLHESGIDPLAVRTVAAFERLPATTKLNYHRAYPLPELCRNGELESCDFVAVSSGSTGEPALWPRFVSDEFGTAARFEQVLRDGFRAHERRTLGVVCFALGSWVGGMYTTAACRHVASKGYPLTLVTPGSNKTEILRVVRALGPLFEQVVLFGYPPFLKDVIDAGRSEGLDWASFQPGIVTAGEVFSEEWRSLVCGRLGGIDPLCRTASLYGTADGGVLANETPLSIRIRRFLAEHPPAMRELFGEARLPTLCQYDPLHRYFECDAGQLLFSGDGGAPLVRYKILDHGGLLPYRELLSFLGDHGYDPVQGFAERVGAPARELPFVYVFGRSNFALSFYGANIYPENVAIGLERPEIAEFVTGKFVMQIVNTEDQDSELQIFVELAASASPGEDLARKVSSSIRSELERVNSEFLNYAPPERRTPKVELLPLANPEYFPAGVKHRYTRP
jgi:phenylacetate-CoA ligase